MLFMSTARRVAAVLLLCAFVAHVAAVQTRLSKDVVIDREVDMDMPNEPIDINLPSTSSSSSASADDGEQRNPYTAADEQTDWKTIDKLQDGGTGVEIMIPKEDVEPEEAKPLTAEEEVEHLKRKMKKLEVEQHIQNLLRDEMRREQAQRQAKAEQLAIDLAWQKQQELKRQEVEEKRNQEVKEQLRQMAQRFKMEAEEENVNNSKLKEQQERMEKLSLLTSEKEKADAKMKYERDDALSRLDEDEQVRLMRMQTVHEYFHNVQTMSNGLKTIREALARQQDQDDRVRHLEDLHQFITEQGAAILAGDNRVKRDAFWREFSIWRIMLDQTWVANRTSLINKGSYIKSRLDELDKNIKDLDIRIQDTTKIKQKTKQNLYQQIDALSQAIDRRKTEMRKVKVDVCFQSVGNSADFQYKAYFLNQKAPDSCLNLRNVLLSIYKQSGYRIPEIDSLVRVCPMGFIDIAVQSDKNATVLVPATSPSSTFSFLQLSSKVGTENPVLTPGAHFDALNQLYRCICCEPDWRLGLAGTHYADPHVGPNPPKTPQSQYLQSIVQSNPSNVGAAPSASSFETSDASAFRFGSVEPHQSNHVGTADPGLHRTKTQPCTAQTQTEKVEMCLQPISRNSVAYGYFRKAFTVSTIESGCDLLKKMGVIKETNQQLMRIYACLCMDDCPVTQP